MDKIISIAISLIMIVFISIILAWPIMWLWNWIIPALIPGVGVLTWGKALGLSVLCGFLFKSTTYSSSN